MKTITLNFNYVHYVLSSAEPFFCLFVRVSKSDNCLNSQQEPHRRRVSIHYGTVLNIEKILAIRILILSLCDQCLNQKM